MVITIDGYAGSGKTSAAARLAAALDYELLPTGLMYRAAGAALADAGLDLAATPHDGPRVAGIVAGFVFDMPPGRVVLNGTDVTDRCHREGAGDLASRVGTFPEVRAKLKAEQRRLAAGRRIVCEGRDQGTAVFPEARFKFFLWASPEVRAERRVGQLRAAGREADPAAILARIVERDHRDETRAIDPLTPAEDALRIDTTVETPDEVLAAMLDAVNHP